MTLGEELLQVIATAGVDDAVAQWCASVTHALHKAAGAPNPTPTGDSNNPIAYHAARIWAIGEPSQLELLSPQHLTHCAGHLRTTITRVASATPHRGESLQHSLLCMLAHGGLQRRIPLNPKGNQRPLWDCLAAAQEAITAALLRVASAGFTVLDLSEAYYPPGAEVCLEQWMRQMPYGRDGTLAYCMINEVALRATGRRPTTQEMIATLLHRPRDVRRAADVLLHFAHPELALPGRVFTPGQLNLEDAELFLRRCATGVTAPHLWAILDRPGLITRSIDDLNTFNSGSLPAAGRATGPYSTRPGHGLSGKWYHLPLQVGGFSISSERRGVVPGGFTYSELGVPGGGASSGAAGELRMIGDAALPACPLGDFAVQCGCLVGGGVVWFSEVIEVGSNVHVETARAPDAEFLLQQAALPAEQRDTEAMLRITYSVHESRMCARRDDLTNEPAVAFCSRLLHATLEDPPTPDLAERLERTLQCIRVLPRHFLLHLQRQDCRRFHPATLLVMFQAMIKTSHYFHDSIFGSNGWLLSQAKTRPSMKLVALLALAFQADIPVQPKDAVSALQHISLHETKLGEGNEPIAVLQCLDAATRHEYDGLWSWQRGDAVYPSAVLIVGHHVVLTHPAFSHAEVIAVSYESASMSFSVAFRCPVSNPTLQGLAGGGGAAAAGNAAQPGSPDTPSPNDTPDATRGGMTVVIRRPADSGVAGPPPRLDITWYGHRMEVHGEFTRVAEVPHAGWGNKAIQSCQKLLQDIALGWDASSLNPGRGAAALLQQVLSDRPVSTPHTPYEDFLIDIWSLSSQRMLKSPRFKSPQQLDEWVLLHRCPQPSSKTMALVTFTGLRHEAARRLLLNFFQIRKVVWDAVPIPLSTLRSLEPAFPEATAFVKRVQNASCELRSRIETNRISLVQLRHMEKYTSVLSQNGVALCDTRPALESIFHELEGMARMLREIIERWHVRDNTLLPKLEDTIRHRDLMPLVTLEEICASCREVLAPALELPGSASSPLIKAFFIQLHGEAEVTLGGFADAFREACARVGSLSLDTPMRDAVCGIPPQEADYTESRRAEEQGLLGSLGCTPEVIHAVLHGALPLRFMTHDLAAFRRLVEQPHEDLQLHGGFFAPGEAEQLLTIHEDHITLREAEGHVAKILKDSSGCQHRVLRIVDTVLQCPRLVRFARDNPEAQDAGLSSVLSNSRDVQHACFQTFLNCCAYINPFVSASQKHVALYEAQQAALRDGEETGVILRPPINCNSAWGTGEGPGFWESLNRAFGDSGFESIAAIRDMILKMSGDDSIGELEVMIKEQNGTTDKLVEGCRLISGLPSEDGAVPAEVPALMVVHFPATGQPRLECRHGSTTRNGSEYRDLIYRATLQKDLSPILADFVAQARDVLRAFNAACKVFSEGHIEFRSRRLSFRHNDAARSTRYLQALQGQWASESADRATPHTSVFLEACVEHPELSCVTPAELVRMAELLRSVRSVGDVTLDEARSLSRAFREPPSAAHRTAPGAPPAPCFSEGCPIPAGIQPTPMPCVGPVASTTTAPGSAGDGAAAGCGGGSTPDPPSLSLVIEGAGVFDGRYTEGLWCYRRTGEAEDEDGSPVLCPVKGAWVVYGTDGPGAAPLLRSVTQHAGRSQPWEMGDWQDPTDVGGPVLSLKVQVEDGHNRQLVWSAGARHSEQSISVIGAKDLRGLGLAQRGEALWIDSVASHGGAVWDSIGLERGMQITAVNNEGAPAPRLEEALAQAAGLGRPFSITATPSWVWSACSGATISSSQRAVTNASKTPLTVISRATGETWRIRVSGNVRGMRVGLCTPDFDPASPLDIGGSASHAWWYIRCGLLRHAGVDSGSVRPFRSGDVITVTRSSTGAELYLNGVCLQGGFGSLPAGQDLHPVVRLEEVTCSAELSPGAPVVDVCRWNVMRHSPLIQISSDLTKAKRAAKEGKSGIAAAAIGDAVFRGPGPHTFSFQLVGQSIQECLVGVAPPAVFLDKQSDPETALFGLTVRSDGNIFGLKENRILSTPKKKVQFTSSDVVTFELDLGEGTIEILKNGERILHSSSVDDLPRICGPLVPYCVLPNTDVECRLVPTPNRTAGHSDPSVVIKAAPAQAGYSEGAAELPAAAAAAAASPLPPQLQPLLGVYQRCVPTYVREDGAFQVFHWGDRWCVTDRAETPFAWSDKCDADQRLGTAARQWTVVQHAPTTPGWVSLKVGGAPPVLLRRASPEGVLPAEVVYEAAVSGVPPLRLAFDGAAGSWVVTSGGVGAVYRSVDPAVLPTHGTAWAWACEGRWVVDDRVTVTPSRGAADADAPEAKVVLSASVRAVSGLAPAPWCCVGCGVANPPQAVACSQVGCEVQRPPPPQDLMDVMTPQEMAGWHIVKHASGAACSAPQMRVALEESAEGSQSGVEVVMSWTSAAEAIQATRDAARSQLQCIGLLLRRLKAQQGRPGDVLEASNFDPSEPKYGLMQVKAIESNIVDTSRLTPSDRRAFGLSLFKGILLPYHVLDCDKRTPPEDVRAFIVHYRLMKQGRLVVFNIQALGPDLQNEVKRAAMEAHPRKQLIALITEAGVASESVEFVDNNACDVRWRRWAHDRVVALRKFESITYFDHPTGTGKTHTINAMVQRGHWGALRPTRLDLDSTKTSTEAACLRLMEPLRAPQGLLLVHVAHDADPAIVNRVLDGLALLGRVSSHSGLSVVTPAAGWHLVVEFQEGSPDASGPCWRRPDGSSDITLLSCRGFAEQGQLEPFDIASVPRGGDALAFLMRTLDYLGQDEEEALRMLALGMSERPDATDEEAMGGFKKQLRQATARMLHRALKFAAKTLPLNPTSSRNLAEKEMRTLEALAMAHEMRHVVNPSDPDHFHMKIYETPGHRRVVMSQLSGSTPPVIQAAVDEWRQAVEKFSSMSPPILRFEANTPPHQLVDVLTEELNIDHIKTCASKLAEKSYVVIPDFLQKLLQVNTGVALGDPVVLQGPSGTGKSYAITMLADLLQLPSRTKARKGFIDIQQKLISFIRLDRDVKKMFPNNISDMVGGVERVIWTAETGDRIQLCLNTLLDHKCLGGLQLVASSLVSTLGPHIAEATEAASRPPLAGPPGDATTPQSPQKPRSLGAPVPAEKEAMEAILGGTIQALKGEQHCKAVCSHIGVFRRWLRRIGGGLLNLQIDQCIEGVLQSGSMRSLAGSAFEVIQKHLESKPKVDAALAWAAEAVQRAGTNGPALTQLVRSHMREHVRESPLLQPPPELVRALAEGDGPNGASGEELAKLMTLYLSMSRAACSKCVLMRYNMTPAMLFAEVKPILEAALASPDIQFVILLDEMNATHMLGLLKRIVIDRRWDMWDEAHPESQGELPANVAFIGAINPAKRDTPPDAAEGSPAEPGSGGEAGEEEDPGDVLGFDVTPMPESLTEHIIPWRQLEEQQRAMFISRLIASNPVIFQNRIPAERVELLGNLLLLAHRTVQRMCTRKRSAVSQRDVHRAVQIFEFFFKRRREYIHNMPCSSSGGGGDTWVLALSSMILGLAISYYFRLPHGDRASLSAELTNAIAAAVEGSKDSASPILGLPSGMTFASVIENAVQHFCGDHLQLPDAVYAHGGLKQNLFVQMVCFDIRIAVILHGPPGTSKTLSNNIIRDNMTGRGDFWGSLCTISEMCRYQGSAQSSADEIMKKCEEARQGQRRHDLHGQKHKRCLLFVDEAGLIKGEGIERKYALKVLHYYLEGCGIASVLMTNQALDPAIGNRCVEVYMSKPHTDELSMMCAGILHSQGLNGLTELARKAVPACCSAFHNALASGGSMCWWYGLRDLFHLMRYIRRNQPPSVEESGLITVTPRVMTRALERNFNGQPAMFDKILQSFGAALQAACGDEFACASLRGMLRRKIDVVVDSILDNNRATAGASGKNLNDMWVRFKLFVDNTDDGSALRLLQHSGISQLDDVQVFSLSSLSHGDELMAVTVVSQVAAAMETGRTVWLTNTREIDGCLFDVFNQSYVVASNGKGDILHFVAVAIGAALEYKRVHRDFQCIVHVTKREAAAMGDVLPAPYLNRLEKFTISTPDILQHALSRLCEEDRLSAMSLRNRLDDFCNTLSLRNRCVFSDNPSETLDSLVLQVIQSGSLRPLPLPTRLASDTALRHFLFDDHPTAPTPPGFDTPSSTTSVWRSATATLLELMVPDSMLAAQEVLRASAPAYLRAYFRDLNPWDLAEYVRGVCADTARGEPGEWRRTVVYAPANADFAALLEGIGGVHIASITGLRESDCGAEDLDEAIYKFSTDPAAHAFIALADPDSVGMPECSEMRAILDRPPEVPGVRSAKSVILLQIFQTGSLFRGTQCTPLYASGWGQVYIDAGAGHTNAPLSLYVSRDVIGHLPPRPAPEWVDMEAALPHASYALMQAQLQAQAGWVRIPDSDGAAALYQPKTAFGEQVVVARELLSRCTHTRRCILMLHRAALPAPRGLVAMAHEVAQKEGASASLSQRLVDEENKAPRTLLAHALWHLLDDRAASVFLSSEGGGGGGAPPGLLPLCDKLISMALSHALSRTRFDELRWTNIGAFPPLFVGASPPALPGSRELQAILSADPAATSATAEAERLQRVHGGGPVGDMVELIHASPQWVVLFFSDCVRRSVLHQDREVCSSVVEWALQLARGMHHSAFGGAAETVWSVQALCTVEVEKIAAYVLTLMPLAIAGALKGVSPPADPAEGERCLDWAANELCPDALARAAPALLRTHPGRQRLAACAAALCHRATLRRITASRSLPTLLLASKVLDTENYYPASEGTAAAAASTALPESDSEAEDDEAAQGGLTEAGPATPSPVLPLEKLEAFIGSASGCDFSLDAIRAILESAPAATPDVALCMMELSVHRDAPQGASPAATSPFILQLLSSGVVTRGMACRILRGIATPLDSPDDTVADLLYAEACRSSGTAESDSTVLKYVRYTPPSPPMEGVLGAAVYTALFDVSYDQAAGLNGEALEGLGPVGLAELRGGVARRLAQRRAERCPGGVLAAMVQLCAVEQAFIQALSRAFLRPAGMHDVRWAPALMEDLEKCALVSRTARELMEPAGFVCPKRGSEEDRELIRNPPDAHAEGNMMALIHALENGCGTLQGMGTKAMLEFLRDQVFDQESGALVAVCGEGMRHKCQNAEPLATRPGDLPFVYKIDDPLYDFFLSLRRHVQVGAEAETPDLEQVEAVAAYVKVLAEALPVEQARTLLFYCGFRCYFGVCGVHVAAKQIAYHPGIAESLGLVEKQQRLLHLALDREQCPRINNLGVTGSLLEGFDNAWTQMMCTAGSIAAAMPDTLLGTLLLDVDKQRDKFLPGDKTGGPIAHGGNYKFDCVTQLDPAGNLDSYACKQPVLSTGGCYLLWGIEFGALTLHLSLFPDAFDTICNWFFSKTIQTRDFMYQRNLSDYELMISQLTERSMAYHLHMGAHTGLSCDEAQRVYTFFMYHLLTGNPEDTAELLRTSSDTREQAMAAERVVEAFWQDHTTEGRQGLSRPQSDMCHTLKALSVWMEGAQPSLLPRGDVVLQQLDCLGGAHKPLLVDAAVHEGTKLSLLTPLLLHIVQFSKEVHGVLSGRLESHYTRGDTEERVAYLPVLELLGAHAVPRRFEALQAQMAVIKRLWNAFRRDVGPIDFECEEGGINIAMPEEASDAVVGSPGLPDTLDFWITCADSSDPNHKDLIKAAILSLTDKYNRCQDVVAKFFPIDMSDVDPLLLSPESADLVLTKVGRVAEVCRSYVGEAGVDWDGVNRELRFLSGLVLPKLQPPHFKAFEYKAVDTPLDLQAIQLRVADALSGSPDHLAEEPSAACLTALQEACRSFAERQVAVTLLSLVAVFEGTQPNPADTLYTALKEKWSSSETGLPLVPAQMDGLYVRHTRVVMRAFLRKVDRTDWLTWTLPDALHEALPDDLLSGISERLRAYIEGKALDEAIEGLSGLLSVLCSALENPEYLQPGEDLIQFIHAIFMADDDAVTEVFMGCRIEHIVSLCAFIKRRIRMLSRQMQRKAWSEEGAHLVDTSYLLHVARPASDTLVLNASCCIVSLAAPEGQSPEAIVGHRLVRVGDEFVTSQPAAEACLSALQPGSIVELGLQAAALSDRDGVGGSLHVDPMSPL